MSDAAWYADDDPRSLPQRVERVLTVVREHESGSCGACGRSICGHAVVFSIVSGHEDRPLCLDCIAGESSREPETVRDQMTLFVQSKPCLTQGWRLASVREGLAADALPSCMWGEGGTPPAPPAAREDAGAATDDASDLEPADWFDAGDQGCGELVLALRIRLNEVAPGEILRLTATDPGAPEDIPSWCRLTGNRLVSARHPDYYIERRKADS